MIEVKVAYERNGMQNIEEHVMEELDETASKDMINLNVFRSMFDSELPEELGIENFHVTKIKNEDEK